MNKSFIIQGKYSSSVQKTLEISVNKCNNSTDPGRLCAPQNDIDDFVSAQVFYTIYYINPLINP